MTAPLKIGLIGLDTSHVAAFTKIFNDASYEFHIPGAKVTCAWPGGSPDLEVSHSRVDKFTAQLQGDFNVKILPSPEDVAREADLVFITAVDGRAHRELFEKTAFAGKPTFIDKPFAATLEDAQAIVDLAAEKKIPLATCSSLRFSDKLTDALKDAAADDPAFGVDVFGPMQTQPELPGLLWYGVHAIEMMVRVMGTGAKTVQTVTTEGHDLVTVTFDDGRIASYHGMRGVHNRFGLLIHRKSGVQFVDASAFDAPWYYSMLKELLPAFAKGESAVPVKDSLTVMQIIDAANRSRESQGKAIATTAINAH